MLFLLDIVSIVGIRASLNLGIVRRGTGGLLFGGSGGDGVFTCVVDGFWLCSRALILEWG